MTTPEVSPTTTEHIIDSDATERDKMTLLQEMFSAHYEDLIGYAIGKHGYTREAAEDIVQDVFMKALNALDKYVDAGKHEAWLRVILDRTVIDAWRKNRREQTTDPDASLFRDRVDSRPSSGFSGAEYRQTLDIASRISNPQSIAILADHAIHGYTYEEIAERHDTEVGTIRSRLSRTKVKLRYNADFRSTFGRE